MAQCLFLFFFSGVLAEAEQDQCVPLFALIPPFACPAGDDRLFLSFLFSDHADGACGSLIDRFLIDRGVRCYYDPLGPERLREHA